MVFKPTLSLPGGKVKGNIDAELVLHAMIEYSNYNKAAIVTGDGDFHCLIEYLKKQGKLERLIIPNRYKFSSLLRKFVKDMVFMSDLRAKLEINKKRGITAGRTLWITSHRDTLEVYNIEKFCQDFLERGRRWIRDNLSRVEIIMKEKPFLTPKQERVLNFIRKRIGGEAPPTIREIGEELGFKSTGTVRDYLRVLMQKGLVRRMNNKSRAIELTERASFNKIPRIGTIMAGKPNLAYEEIQGYVDADDPFLGA